MGEIKRKGHLGAPCYRQVEGLCVFYIFFLFRKRGLKKTWGFSVDFYFQYHKVEGENKPRKTSCIVSYVAMNYQGEYELHEVYYI